MRPEKGLPLQIRHANEGDIAFIFNSWLKSYRDGGFLANSVPNTIYFDNHHKLLQKVLQRSTVFVACDTKDPTQIMGYIVAETIEGIFVLHYIYVKHSFRKLGVARELLNQFDHDSKNASCFTHCNRTAMLLAAKYNMIYHPYLILLDYEVPVDTSKSEPG